MHIKNSIFGLFIATVLLVSTTIANAETFNCKVRSEKALKLLADQINKDKLYESRLPNSCYSYRASNCTNASIDIEVNEIHNKECGGDSLTTHVLDRYRVKTKTNLIEWYYLPEGKYVPYNKKHLNR